MTARTADVPHGHYSEEVRRLFRTAAHAGSVPGAAATGLVAEIAEGGAGAVIRIEAEIENGRWRLLRYRIFGCPHLIAAAESVCARLEGRPLGTVAPFPVAEIMQMLEIPVEKTGRVLLLEDAFAGLAAKAGGRG